jgi:hypothetical protein
MKRSQKAIRAALEQLKVEGVIHPADVVEAARDDQSPLHDLFQWDDGEAAHQFRLIQARKVLQVYVVMEEVEQTNVRAFVSLTTDRVNGGGYRAMADVMNDDELCRQMLSDAFVQLRNLRTKYKGLQQLAKVWAAADEAEAQATKIANAA